MKNEFIQRFFFQFIQILMYFGIMVVVLCLLDYKSERHHQNTLGVYTWITDASESELMGAVSMSLLALVIITFIAIKFRYKK